MPLNLRFIPLSRSLLPERQKNYDFLVEGRVQYGFSNLKLEQQGDHEPAPITNLRASICSTTREIAPLDHKSRTWQSLSWWRKPVEEMRKSEWFPMLVVAGWNARDQDMHVEMLAAQAWPAVAHSERSRRWRNSLAMAPGACDSIICRSSSRHRYPTCSFRHTSTTTSPSLRA